MNGGQVQEPKLTTRIRPALKKIIIKETGSEFCSSTFIKIFVDFIFSE